ncbi:MAG: Rho termination factor N-terminal domain-containing protein [Novosphingobium sp.]|nr:Rho termination factor N-terminal domain-containing protein [Novosphingobium sp.]
MDKNKLFEDPKKVKLDNINKQLADAPDWKKKQLESKLLRFKQKKYPKLFWESLKQGIHKKEKVNLEELSSEKLKRLAREKKIRGYSKMTKLELIAVLKED